MYRKVDHSLNFLQREEEVLDFWRKERIFQKSVEQQKGKEKFTFYDGPPTANGKPHIGHILTRAIKDLIPRYKTMKGYDVLRKAGWDTHGLPVELEVEKLLGIDGKDQIEAYGVEPFICQCKESVWKYKKEWEDMSERVAFWADMEDPYVTYEDRYIESEWWAMKKIAEQGLLYQGHKIVPYCPRCGTALSSHEVAQGYHDVKEASVYVRFKVVGEDDCYFAAWTTTPWTLPSNVALAVNAKEDYVRIRLDHEVDGTEKKVDYILAEALVKSVFGEEPFEVIERYKGADLEGKAYEPLFDYGLEIIAREGKKAYYVTCADYVTLTDGTGVVHIAPAFGEDDANVGRAYNLPFLQLVRPDGTMSPEVKDFAGLFCKEADSKIIQYLRDNYKMIRKQNYEHAYPHCWRCDTPLIYYARSGWFIKMTELRDQLLANNAKINWIPETIGSGRFGNFLANVIDWSVSRERYWGTPMPVWVCPDGHRHVIGSVEELRQLSPDCPEEIELHRPYIDNVHITCPECGKLMTRVPEVLDCWFDSGSMPFAQWHYPFENKEAFEARFPADFISEAVDQTRGWFYSLLAIATLLFRDKPFNNCIVLGHVCDKDGIKMSKHKGNVVDPWDVLNSEGADAVRWYFYSNSQPWLPSRFSMDAVNEGKRKFMATLWNTYAFFTLYANIANYEAKMVETPEGLGLMDRWILSRLNTLIVDVDKALEGYDIVSASHALERFADELSNWYVRRNRERFWSDLNDDTAKAFDTLYTVLVVVAKLAAPFTPFLAESLYRDLVVGHMDGQPISVHLCDYPCPDHAFQDDALEAQMDLVLRIVALGRTARAASNIKTRQPLAKMLLVSDEPLDPAYADLCTDELNVHRLESVADESSLQDFKFKPQLRTLGRRFGKNLNTVKGLLDNLDGPKAWNELKESGHLTLTVEGVEEQLTEEDLIIERVQIAGYATASEQGLTVALDTELTPELIQEGFIRELISKVQTMRKESNFEVTDRIRLSMTLPSEVRPWVEAAAEEIKDSVLAKELVYADAAAGLKDWDLNGYSCGLAVERL